MNREIGETPTYEEDAAVYLSACLPLGWEVFQVPVVAGVSPLHHRLCLQAPGDWQEAFLLLEGVWKACPAVPRLEKGWELSSWEACPCEEEAWHPASPACFGREKALFVFLSMQTVMDRYELTTNIQAAEHMQCSSK